MIDDKTLPTVIAAVDLMLCVIAALVLGMAVVAHQSWAAWSRGW